MKKCTKCKQDKSISEFRKDKSRLNGIASTCNLCNNILQKEWYDKNKNHIKNYSKERYSKNKISIQNRRKELRKLDPEKYKAKAREIYKKNPLSSKVQSWKQAGIKNMTIQRYNELLMIQNNCCIVCKIPQEKLSRKLDVDHNHITGEVRGLLCLNCNQALGRLKECPNIITNLLKYVEKYKY